MFNNENVFKIWTLHFTKFAYVSVRIEHIEAAIVMPLPAMLSSHIGTNADHRADLRPSVQMLIFPLDLS